MPGLGFYAYLRFHVDSTKFRRWNMDPAVAAECPPIVHPEDIASVGQPLPSPGNAQPAAGTPSHATAVARRAPPTRLVPTAAPTSPNSQRLSSSLVLPICNTISAPSKEGSTRWILKSSPTARAGFLQAAQTIAVREHHQRIAPAHLLKALLDDEQGMAAGLIEAAGGDAKAAQREVDALVAKIPAVTGSGATQAPALDGDTIRILDQAEQVAKKAGDSYVTVERILLAMALAKNTDVGGALAEGRAHAAEPQRRDRQAARRPHRRHARRPRTATTR